MGVLCMAKGIIIMKLRRHMVTESRHIHHGADVKSISRSRHGKRGSKTHSHAHARSMEVASLVVI